MAMVAAVVCCVVSGSVFWLWRSERQGKHEIARVEIPIVPGERRAVLVLDNGQRVKLSGGSELKVEEKSTVISIKDNHIVYSREDSLKIEAVNRVYTPRGGEYSLELSDGTIVWLNAESELSYPVRFKNDCREVEVNGEAYFEVAKCVDRPFIVNANGMRIRVLGTSFNVRAYEGEERLTAAGCPDADFDARELFRLATGRDVRLSDRPLDAAEAAKLEELTVRRAAREPLQYLCGSWPFLDFELAVGPGVLCPRADTEVVAETAAEMLAGVEAPRALDLCAGTGCLGLGVKRLCPAAQVVCVEKSPEAYVYLEKNTRLALKGRGGSTENVLDASPFEEPAFDWGMKPTRAAEPVEGDLFTYWESLPEGQLDLIVSNPPYLTAQEMSELQPEVAKEPAMALEAGEDGLVFYKAIAEHYQKALRPGGALALEIGWQQREAVTALLEANGWADIACRKDFGGNDRCVTARRPK